MPNINRLFLLLSLLLLCACESGWDYRWIVENRSGRTLRTVIGRGRDGYAGIATVWKSDTIPSPGGQLLFEESRINSGPCPGTHPFVLQIYSGDTLIYSEDVGGSENWSSVYSRRSPIFPVFVVNLRLLVSDTGVVWRERCNVRRSEF